MAALVGTSRVLLERERIRDVLRLAERAAATLRGTSLLPEHPETLARARALAYRWSKIIPGCSCLHRAVSTQVFLGAFRMQTRVVLGVRRTNALEGHAWLEVHLGDAATLLFVDDTDGYPVRLDLS